MNGFKKRAALIKEKIMSITLEMLKHSEEAGSVRIADIAKLADVSQVTIYNYFGNKENLIRDVLKKYISTSIDELIIFMNKEITFKEKIESLILQKQASLHDFSPSWANKILVEDEEMVQFIHQQYNEQMIPIFMQLVEEGKASGEISEKISVQSFLLLLNMYMSQTKVLMQAAEQQGNFEIFEELVHLFFYGICGKP